MSLTNSPIWFGSGATGGDFYGYEINDSLRFNDNDSAYLNRTPSTASNRKTWTFSAWIKLCSLTQGERGIIFQSNYGGPTIYQDSGLRFAHAWDPAGTDYIRETVAIFRDPSAWYHVVWWCDTTQAGTRWKIYVNGVEQSLQTPSGNNGEPAQNTDLNINSANSHTIGNFIGNYFDGYMAEVNFIDGQALDATSFGETKSGVWIPKSYGGSYGTNGFYLDFSNNSTATNLGLDSSGNSNNWSVNGIATTDQMIDTPTNNFATLNSIHTDNTITLSEGNLKIVHGYDSGVGTTFGFNPSDATGYYAEFYKIVGSYGEIGIAPTDISDLSKPATTGKNGYMLYLSTGQKANNGSYTAYGSTVTAGDIVSVAVKDGKIWWGVNGVWIASGDPENGTNPAFSGISGEYFFIQAYDTNAGTALQTIANFGQDSTFAGTITAGGNSDGNGIGDFKYSVPSGYLALCSANLPEPVVGPLGGSISTENFNTLLWTGNGSNPRTLSGLDFTADFIWHKSRSSASMSSHAIQDVVRGFDTNNNLYTNLTASETDYPNRGVINSVSSTGYTVNENASDYSTADGLNENSQTFVSWNWKAGGTAVSNTDGSITSQVSANVDAGFSIVSYTGNATTNATIGHGLGVAPDFIIHKNRSVVDDWSVWSSALPNTTGYKLILNLTSAQQTTSNYPTLPTSSVFYVGAIYNLTLYLPLP
jgi:hypothetical protein